MTPVELGQWRTQHASISQQTLANHLGVTRLTVWRWENAQTSIPDTLPSQLEQVAAHLANIPPHPTHAAGFTVPEQVEHHDVFLDGYWYKTKTHEYEAAKERYRQGRKAMKRLQRDDPSRYDELVATQRANLQWLIDNKDNPLATPPWRANERTSDLPAATPMEQNAVSLPSRAKPQI